MTFNKKSMMIGMLFAMTLNGQGSVNKRTIVDRVMGFFGQLHLIHRYDSTIQLAMNKELSHKLMQYGDEPASEVYQAMGKEAQDALGIPLDHQVPVKKLNPSSPIAPLAAAIAEPDAIYVNEEALQQRGYGAQRSVLFHEAVHRKYHDNSVDGIIELLTLTTAGIATHKLIKAIKPVGRFNFFHALGVIVGSFTAASLTSAAFHRHMERRADIEGHYATQCSLCVQESAVKRKQSFENQNHPLRNAGYLSAEELESIASDLKEQNKVCAFHSECH